EPLPPALAQLDLGTSASLRLPGYTPSEDSFKFANEDVTQAIQTSRHQPEWLDSFTLSLSQLFGAQVCVGQDVERCILTAAAQNWLAAQIDLMAQGVCDGIAAASLFLWQPASQSALPGWQKLLAELTPFNRFQVTADNPALQTFVANQALLQGVDEVYLPTQEIRENLTPKEVLAELVNNFRSAPQNPYTIGIYRQQDDQLVEGHSLLPYRIEPGPNNQYRVYVFDSNLPATTRDEPYLLFDVEADTWSYEPADVPAYAGDAQSENLDLTQLSWRLPPENTAGSADASELATEGPFTCPFCGTGNQTESLEVALIGQGQLQVYQFDNLTGEYVSVAQATDRVPFKGGLDRAVPARYSLLAEGSDRPFKITITGTVTSVQEDLTLQIVGPGYTAGFEKLRLAPEETLTMYVTASERGPELAFVAHRGLTIPHLSIYLEDDFTASPATTAEPETLADNISRDRMTNYSKHVSYSFNVSDIFLPTGRTVGVSVDRTLKRFYFADNDSTNDDYTLNIIGRTKEEQTTQIETREDFPNGEFEITTRTERRTRRYEESLQVSGVEVDYQSRAYFDYGNWAQIPTTEDDLAEISTTIEVPIAYDPLPTPAVLAGPLSLNPPSSNPEPPTAQTRLYRGNLIKSNYR
ncbi:MAG: hypothetical protein AAFY20_12150, partial [Cyanobacteria bacterium J06639_14]